ncbi:Nitrogen permease regulator 2 [Malassezia psittaci]|uniref:N-alpha-acetyltransferase 40 n=1 Tax=Malassezia psittaci TaxID=1821823 RepID=A0AAF0F9F4_9BASI|nr:Nitrogen permease regulator 2 [Malassezia psittaci]
MRIENQKGSESIDDIAIECARASELSVFLREEIYILLERNMRAMYEQNWSWDDSVKRSELEHPSSRFLLAILPRGKDTSVRRRTRHSGSDPCLIGFIMWRFEDYDALPDDPVSRPLENTMEVAYCYEMQINAAHRGRGIGSQLLQLLEAIAWRTHMRKVVLTVFKDNLNARKFYTKCKYVMDATSPSDDPDDPYRAVIMSKSNREQPALSS